MSPRFTISSWPTHNSLSRKLLTSLSDLQDLKEKGHILFLLVDFIFDNRAQYMISCVCVGGGVCREKVKAADHTDVINQGV